LTTLKEPVEVLGGSINIDHSEDAEVVGSINIDHPEDTEVVGSINIDHPEYTAVVGSINIANLKIWKSWVQ
jgi:hypothetical protein